MGSFNERTHKILSDIGEKAATKAASGRYLRSLEFRPGIRYWATSARQKDLFGVQFFGEGLDDAERYRRALANRGFASRTPQPSQLTYCREIDFLADGRPDMDAIRAAKADLDGIVRSDDPVERQQRIAEFQRLIDEGLRSGISADTMSDLLAQARRRAETAGGDGL